MEATTIETDMTKVTIPCGCVYAKKNSIGPVHACAEHRYIECGRCGGRAEITPIGTLCIKCSF